MTKFCRAVYVLNHIRGKFWTCQGRRGVNKVSQICVVYKRSHGRTVNGPPLPDPPAYRLSFEYAFSNIGINFAETFYVKNIYSHNKEEMFKCYICLLTTA